MQERRDHRTKRLQWSGLHVTGPPCGWASVRQHALTHADDRCMAAALTHEPELSWDPFLRQAKLRLQALGAQVLDGVNASATRPGLLRHTTPKVPAARHTMPIVEKQVTRTATVRDSTPDCDAPACGPTCIEQLRLVSECSLVPECTGSKIVVNRCSLCRFTRGNRNAQRCYTRLSQNPLTAFFASGLLEVRAKAVPVRPSPWPMEQSTVGTSSVNA